MLAAKHTIQSSFMKSRLLTASVLNATEDAMKVSLQHDKQLAQTLTPHQMPWASLLTQYEGHALASARQHAAMQALTATLLKLTLHFCSCCRLQICSQTLSAIACLVELRLRPNGVHIDVQRSFWVAVVEPQQLTDDQLCHLGRDLHPCTKKSASPAEMTKYVCGQACNCPWHLVHRCGPIAAKCKFMVMQSLVFAHGQTSDQARLGCSRQTDA